jgi:hypothetical protein
VRDGASGVVANDDRRSLPICFATSIVSSIVPSIVPWDMGNSITRADVEAARSGDGGWAEFEALEDLAVRFGQRRCGFEQTRSPAVL